MEKTAVDIAVERLEKLIPSGNQMLIGIILDEAKGIERLQSQKFFRDGWIEASKYYNYEEQTKTELNDQPK
jgi:hypothetical protein